MLLVDDVQTYEVGDKKDVIMVIYPIAAGMLMFGDEYNIVRHFPEYFLDYREELDPTTRWSDRLQSSSGEWSGNVCDFYFRVYNKIIKDVKVPFKMSGGERIDDTPVHKAIGKLFDPCRLSWIAWYRDQKRSRQADFSKSRLC